MQYVYKIRTDEILDEARRAHAVYGVDVFCGKVLLKEVPDIFCSKDEAEQFVALCNASELDIEHLIDVIEDAIVA